MRVLFVYPNINTRNGLHYPHGLGALAAVCARAGHEPVVRMPESMPTRRQWQADLDAIQPDLLVGSFGSNQWRYAAHLMDWARQTGCRVLAGGVHASFAPQQVLASGCCDWVCVGEGEGALLDLLAEKQPVQIDRIQGTGFANEPRKLVSDLDTLPLYDRRHFPMAEIGRVNAHEVTALVGRGCPFPCTYCCNEGWQKLYRGQQWVRWRSVENVLAELELLLSRYRVDCFYFEDDIFTLNRSFLDEFLQQYARHYAVPFRAYLRIDQVEREDLQRLKQAGLWMANVGVEHGDERIREEVLKRKMSNARIEQFFNWCRELGIRTRAFHIVGVPGEMPATFQTTVDLCARMAPDEVQVSLFEPYPGTSLYEMCLERELLKGTERDTYFQPSASIVLPDFPEDELIASYQSFCRQAPDIEAQAFELALSERKRGDVDLIARWTEENVVERGAEPVARMRVRVGAEEKFCLFAHPRSRVEYHLDPGSYRFHADLALNPKCLDWGGGGARFLVCVGGQTLLDRFIDPKHNPDDRGWQAVEQPFEFTEAGTLVLETQPDKDGDLTALWALWGHPHLIREDD